jgi:Rieske 2Fe-2S family protein
MDGSGRETAGVLAPAAANAVARHVSGHSLTREFYVDDALFAADVARIHHRHWIFVGYSFEVANPGDWMTYSLAGAEIVVARGQDSIIRAFHNVCRHRGSKVCLTEHGHSSVLACPYHKWTYRLDGGLMLDTKKEFGVDRSELGLRPVKLIDAGGLLFFSLSDDPPDFTEAADTIRRKMKPHAIERAKIAHTVEYVVKADWKVVFQNNRECYHCPANHKEYNTAAYDVQRDNAVVDPTLLPGMEAIIAKANARFAALGLDTGDVSSNMTGVNWRCHRTPVREGFVTQSMDGKMVSRLMGDIKEPDSGTLRTTVFPNFWQHTNCDFAAAARLTPIGPGETHVRGYWLVDGTAVEGKDYTLDKLLPIWDITNRQDWKICEDQQAGVSSPGYVPGPYSTLRERNVTHFDDWYIGELRG